MHETWKGNGLLPKFNVTLHETPIAWERNVKHPGNIITPDLTEQILQKIRVCLYPLLS